MREAGWLLSSAAQSTAAIVAIVGGFLISRLVAIVSERRGLEHAGDNLRLRHGVASERLKKVIERLDRWDRDDFLDYATLALLSNERISFDEFVKTEDLGHIDKAPFEDLFDARADLVRRALSDVRSQIQLPQSVVELRSRGVRIEEGEEDVYAEAIREVRRERGSIAFPAISAVSNVAEVSDERTRRRELERDQEDLERQVEGLSREIEQTNLAVARLSTPTLFYPAIAVLSYFSLVGVVYPMTLMSLTPRQPTGHDVTLVLVLFCSGLVAVILFLLFAVWSAHRGASSETVDSHSSPPLG